MADSQHTTPAPGANPRIPNNAPALDWPATMAAYLVAKEEAEAYNQSTWLPHYHKQESDPTHRIPDDVDAELERLDAVRDGHDDRLLLIPAPDHAALIWKLDRLLVAAPGESVTPWADRWVAPTIADYRRMLGTHDEKA